MPFSVEKNNIGVGGPEGETMQFRELFVIYRARKVSFAIFVANILGVVLCGRVLNLLMIIHVLLNLVT